MTLSGSAGYPAENWMHVPVQLLPEIGPLRVNESEKQAASVPAAATRMARCTSLVLAGKLSTGLGGGPTRTR